MLILKRVPDGSNTIRIETPTGSVVIHLDLVTKDGVHRAGCVGIDAPRAWTINHFVDGVRRQERATMTGGPHANR